MRRLVFKENSWQNKQHADQINVVFIDKKCLPLKRNATKKKQFQLKIVDFPY